MDKHTIQKYGWNTEHNRPLTEEEADDIRRIIITDAWSAYVGRHLSLIERVNIIQVANTLNDTFGWPIDDTVESILETLKKVHEQHGSQS